MDRIKFDIDLGAINKAQEINIKAFKGINSVALTNVSESISCISKFDTGILKLQKNYTGISSLFSGLKDSIAQLNLGSIECMKGVTKSMSELSDILNFNASTYLKGIKTEGIADSISRMEQSITKIYSDERFNDNIRNTLQILGERLDNYSLLHFYPKDISDEEIIENEKVNNKVLEEIFKPEQQENINKENSAIIKLSPINDEVLKYLSENPQAFYQLTSREFENVMAEIYNKLGYKVELTQSTRDGGKDIIIRKPEILGDFIYYVECKRYDITNHVGIGVMRSFVGTVDTDRVNGGILATTSSFTKDAREFILNKNLSYQIKMHDFHVIKDLLNKVV